MVHPDFLKITLILSAFCESFQHVQNLRKHCRNPQICSQPGRTTRSLETPCAAGVWSGGILWTYHSMSLLAKMLHQLPITLSIKPSHLLLTFKALCDPAPVYLSNTTPFYSLSPFHVAGFLVFCLLNPEIFLLPWGFFLVWPDICNPLPNSLIWAITQNSAQRRLPRPPKWGWRFTTTAGCSNSLHSLSAPGTAHVYLFIVWLHPPEC